MKKHHWFLLVSVSVMLLLASHTQATTRIGAAERQRIFAWVDSAQMALGRRELEQARKFYEKARNLAQAQKDYLAAAALQNLLGDLFERVGKYQHALQQYEFGVIFLSNKPAGQLAIPIGELVSQLQGMEKSYSGGRGTPISADLYRGEIGDLRKLLRQDKTRAQQELAVLLMLNAGNMYLQQEQFRLADSLYLQAARVARVSRFGLQQQQLWSNLAWSAIKNRQFPQASVWLDSVLLTASTSSPPVELRRALLAVGVNWREQKNYAKAIVDLQQALTLYKTAHDARGECRAQAHLATAYLYAGDYRNAEKNYREALRRNESVQDDETGWHANGGLAKCYHLLGDLEQATQYYEQYLKQIERIGGSWGTDQGKIGILQNHKQIFQDYVQVALKVAEQKQNFTYARNAIERGRSRVLSGLQLDRLQPPPEKAGHLDAGYFFFREQWEGLRLKLSGGVPSVDVRQMSRNVSNEFAGGVPSPVLDEKALFAPAGDTIAPPPMTFLEYFVLDDRVIIFVKSVDGAVHGAMAPIKADSLAALVAEYGRAIAVETPRGLQFTRNLTPVVKEKNLPVVKRDEAEVARRLYQLLIAPIRAFLPAAPQQTVVIVPHQALWQLPFAALRNATKQFFGDEHVLTYAASETSYRVISRQRRKADHRNVSGWIVGNPTMPAALTRCGGTFKMQPLPGAQREAEEIARLLGNKAELFLGIQADRLRLDAWHPDFSVIHFATHGFACSDDPLSSFIVLAELRAGQLRLDRNTAQVITTKDSRRSVTLDSLQQVLESPTRPNLAELSYPGLLEARAIISRFHLKADLVTLSACQTGLGQLSSEGMIGLSRAFLAAGARSFLVSLWNVDDNATKELMITFYKEYLRHGNKGLALQRAMQQTRQRHPAPKYWAAFTLVGMAE